MSYYDRHKNSSDSSHEGSAAYADGYSDNIMEELALLNRKISDLTEIVQGKDAEIDQLRSDRYMEQSSFTALQNQLNSLQTSFRFMSAKERGSSGGKNFNRIDEEGNEEFVDDEQESEEEEPAMIPFDEDTFSYMMLHPIMSREWFLGLAAIAFQWSLLVLILLDLSKRSVNAAFLNIPYIVPREVTIGQFMGIFICVGVQTDILSSIRMIVAMRNAPGFEWNTIIGLEGDENRTWRNWFVRIIIPNVAKFISGLLVLGVNFITIVQTANIVDLMKDVAALLVISEITTIFFMLAQFGFLGQKFEDTAKLVVDYEVPDPLPTSYVNPRLLLFLILVIGMGGVAAVLLQKQMSGEFFAQQYPKCEIDASDKAALSLFKNGRCEGGILNSIACAFDGGDCINFNLQYPNCDAPKPYEVGDGICQEIYNTKECNFDGADCCPFPEDDKRLNDRTCDGGMYATKNCKADNGACDSMKAQYPKCNFDELAATFSEILESAPRLGDGICESAVYNTEECGFENGDCVECNNRVFDYTLTGDGVCHGGNHNTDICNMDAQDCDDFNRKYPRCYIDFKPADDVILPIVPIIGDGICNSALYNNAECGFEDGDCVLCNLLVEDPTKLGNGMCDGGNYMSEACGYDGGDCIGCDAPRFEVGNLWCTPQYNTTECGYDGGDCLLDQVKQICDVEHPSLIGNGYCNGGTYNTEACDWDGGDCLETYSRKCPAAETFLLGDGYCHGFLNTEECGFDGGDCLDFNAKYENCKVKNPELVGNGWCSGGLYNTLECGWDGGDCIAL